MWEKHGSLVFMAPASLKAQRSMWWVKYNQAVSVLDLAHYSCFQTCTELCTSSRLWRIQRMWGFTLIQWKSRAIHVKDTDEVFKRASGDRSRRWVRFAGNKYTWSPQPNLKAGSWLSLLHPPSPESSRGFVAVVTAPEWRISRCVVHV